MTDTPETTAYAEAVVEPKRELCPEMHCLQSYDPRGRWTSTTPLTSEEFDPQRREIWAKAAGTFRHVRIPVEGEPDPRDVALRACVDALNEAKILVGCEEENEQWREGAATAIAQAEAVLGVKQ